MLFPRKIPVFGRFDFLERPKRVTYRERDESLVMNMTYLHQETPQQRAGFLSIRDGMSSYEMLGCSERQGENR